jgi:hypothetical protein
LYENVSTLKYGSHTITLSTLTNKVIFLEVRSLKGYGLSSAPRLTQTILCFFPRRLLMFRVIPKCSGWKFRVSNPAMGMIFSNTPKRADRLWGPPSLLLNRYRGYFHLEQRLGMCGAIPLFHLTSTINSHYIRIQLTSIQVNIG